MKNPKEININEFLDKPHSGVYTENKEVFDDLEMFKDLEETEKKIIENALNIRDLYTEREQLITFRNNFKELLEK